MVGGKLIWFSLVLGAAYYDYRHNRIENSPTIKEAATMLKSVDLVNGLGILFCLALLPLNVGIEAWKMANVS